MTNTLEEFLIERPNFFDVQLYYLSPDWRLYYGNEEKAIKNLVARGPTCGTCAESVSRYEARHLRKFYLENIQNVYCKSLERIELSEDGYSFQVYSFTAWYPSENDTKIDKFLDTLPKRTHNIIVPMRFKKKIQQICKTRNYLFINETEVFANADSILSIEDCPEATEVKLIFGS